MSKKIYGNNGDKYLDSALIMFEDWPLNELGLIIDYKSNSNGTYVKFNNGLLIQYGNVSITTVDSRSQGGLTYYSGDKYINHPMNFRDNNYCIFTNILMANMNYFAQTYASVETNSQFRISFASTGKNETRTIQWFAIGQWK